MLNKIKVLSITACAAFLLQSCHSDDDALYNINIASEDAPVEVGEVDSSVYSLLRTADPVPTAASGATAQEIADAQVALDKANSINGLFQLAAVASTGDPTSEVPCEVVLRKMSYDTVGGAGEATNSSGVVMVPKGDSEACSGPRPVVLYAHGTNADRNYDLAKIIADPSNPANSEGMIMLAFYASQGYVVIAPNYAGYADSALSYHPYVDEVQQSTEMIDALSHVRTYASDIGVELSSKLFITGLSQGGYVAMATHKALQAKGETVTASVPVSGPYMISKFLDTVMAGFVNGGATTFAPMYLTALDRASNVYDDPADVYSDASWDNIFPNPGANDDGYPIYALFSETSQPPLPNNAFALGYAGQAAPYDTNHVLTDSLRTDYLMATPGSIGNTVKERAVEGDLNDWSPAAPLILCASENDPVVFYNANTATISADWSSNPYVTELNLDAQTLSAVYGGIQSAWQDANVVLEDIHGTTGAYCAGAGLATFNSLAAQP